VRNGKIIVSRQGLDIVQLNGMQTESLKEKLGGLLVLAPLKSDQALWITRCNSIHTFGMKYALDLVYIDKNKQVCGLIENINPWKMSFLLRAQSVMELMAGSIQKMDIQYGDNCKWLD
tara:strand:- start:616 stop:969 length:354 start_codon:yes stop_codon:yes gene_type:complete